MEKFYRAKFINSLSGIKSANLIGSVNTNGVHNLCIVSSCFHLGANPPLIGMILRPETIDRKRHTLDNLRANKVFTINHVNEKIYQKAHQTSANYNEGVSEFEEVGLTPKILSDFKAPFVKESSVQIACIVREIQKLEINKTFLVVGEIERVILDESKVKDDGHIDVSSSIGVTGLDSYHRTEKITRLSYAKPGLMPKTII